ncbi:Hypothetical predicted protein [Olea europaea subsp. europaea]|uniref:PRC-barrel domain-containing protein n=1 Tax=Olea europaea subsp. europaea TaxID=158383 RepID=A0A8S0TYJ2_OLEEU|nr:Hypothetical predicted protein [Olea europaea subsp. europaea]
MYDCLPRRILSSHSSSAIHYLGLDSCSRLSNVSSICISPLKRNFLKIKLIQNSIPFPSDEYEFKDRNSGFMEGKRRLDNQLKKSQSSNDEEEKTEVSIGRNGTNKKAEDSSIDEFLKLRSDKSDISSLAKDEDLVSSNCIDTKLEELKRQQNAEAASVVRSGKQMLRRSNVIAKQVISISSALSLGFVSQLWVDTTSWVVLVLEVRPNLLSGDFERFLLEDIAQVGDVILVEDENVIENDFRLVGLETLVGYAVVTPGRRSIGKVRGYTFNINSGTVESLELDSFGISIIPSGLVSTYALLVDDVLEVLPDTVVVHEAAASRIQRLTKGIWDAQNVGNHFIEVEEDSDKGRRDQGDYRRRDRHSSSRKYRSKMRETTDDWELPMDYL